MAIFSSKFKSGRTTPQIVGHPFTEGADPPTPLTAANTNLPPPSFPQNQSPRTIKIGSSSSPATKGRKDVLASTPSSAGRSYSSPTKWSKSVSSTPIAMLPPSLPPPAYALPPTPEASPDRRASAIFVGSQNAGHSRKPSLGSGSKTLPAPPTSFTSLNTHNRTGSVPLSASQRIDSRSRSASASVFNPHNPTIQGPYPIIAGTNTSLDAGLEASPVFQPPAFGTFGYGSHEPKHRPAALKLKTSNLNSQVACAPQIRIRKKHSIEAIKEFDGQSVRNGFDNDAVKSSGLLNFHSHLHHPRLSPDPNPGHTPTPTYSPRPRPSPTRHQSEETIRPSSERGERPRSFSTNDALNITELDKLRGIDETTRKQRSQPTFNAPHPPPSPTPDRNVNTPGPSSAVSDMSATPGSSYASLPTTTSVSGVKPFDNLPIPWCTRPASDFLGEIGEASYNSLIERSLHEQASVPPQLLHPTILQNSKSEEDRLRSELSRLKEKHFLLVSQRESLAKKIEQGIFKVDQAKLHKMVQALGQASRRVDRVSRQIYICNDQIRQIEIEAKEHVVGVMKIALDRRERELTELGKKDGRYEMEVRGDDSSVVLTPRSHGTTTTVRFLEPPTPGPRSPAKVSEGMRIDFSSTARPMSTATVININSLSFPIPPDRKRNDSLTKSDSTTSLPDLSDECTGQGIGGGLQVEICGNAESADGEFDIESTDSHTTAISIMGPSNEILIYPPGHHRSLSAPIVGLEVPHSAYRSEDGHAPLDMGLIDHHLFKHNHERSISESDLMSPPVSSTLKITAPLRIRNPAKLASQGKGQRQASSLTMRTNENREEMKRVRMGRESVLETPESILLSLATAPIWTKQAGQE